MDGHEDSADTHDRRGHQHGAGHLNQILDLPDVVGGAGQQRRRTEPACLALGERGDVFEHGPAQVTPESGPGAGSEVDGPDRTQRLQPGHTEHHCTEPDDRRGVALRDAVIDDGGIDRRQVQRRQGADQLKRHQHRDQPAVGPDVLAQQCQEHLVTVAHRRRRKRERRRMVPCSGHLRQKH